MIVAIMQPYFFPYIGYFQLMNAVDCFVFYDDAQFMKGGWVNRNRLLRDGEPAWWTYPIVRDDFRLPINRRSYSRAAAAVTSLLGKIDGAYRTAPRFTQVAPLLSDYLRCDAPNVAAFNQTHLQALAAGMGIRSRFCVSSAIDHDRSLSGQDRVIDLCRQLGASRFVNPIGGLDLYDAGAFEDAGLELSFLKAMATDYPQLGQAHVPFLSIVDVLMFNTPDQVMALLGKAESIAPRRATAS